MAHLISSRVNSSYKSNISIDSASGATNRILHLQLPNAVHINDNTDVSILGCPSFFEHGGDLESSLGLPMNEERGSLTSPRCVFSSRPLTIRADASLSFVTSLQLMIGVLMTLAALMISLIRGTPRVTFIDATPAKWNVFKVICVPGSPIDCAPTAPTVDPDEEGISGVRATGLVGKYQVQSSP